MASVHARVAGLARPELSWVAVVLLVLGGCGARSGIEGEGGGQAPPGVGGGGPDGGSPPTTGGAPAEGGSGPGGAPSTGGAGGEGGEGGEGGGPVNPILEACVIASACDQGGEFPLFTVGHCLDQFARLGWAYGPRSGLADPEIAARLVGCADEAGADCDIFRACFGGSWVSLSRCREGAFCDGDRLTDNDGAGFDCGSIGSSCADLWSGAQRACCNAQPCSSSTGVTCDGTVASFCGGWGEFVKFDCGESGRVCQPNLEAPCVGVEAPCDVSEPHSCTGDVASYCSGGKLANLTCGATGFRSACNDGGPSFELPCKPAGNDCDPESAPASCDDETHLRVCVDGSWVSFDCLDVGFFSCGEDGGSARCL